MTLGSLCDELIPAFMQLRHHAIVHKRIIIIVTILYTNNRTYFNQFSNIIIRLVSLYLYLCYCLFLIQVLLLYF